MSTYGNFAEEDINKRNAIFSRTRTTIETAFYGNNMEHISDPATAYRLAAANPNTIVTDLPIIHTDELGLPHDAKMLVDNHGQVVGRTAAARRLIDSPEVDSDQLNGVLREAIYYGSQHKFYTTDVLVGLDEDFMVKAHLALAEGFEVNVFDKKRLDFHEVFEEGVADVKDKFDLAFYVANVETASNQTTTRLDWIHLMAADAPWFMKSIPTVFVSTANPYHLYDIPNVSTFINAYTGNRASIDAVMRKVTGKEDFEGVSPVDPFCGRFETRL